MDRQERNPEPEEVIRRAFRSMLTRVWTCMPAIVQRVDAVAMTLDAQPAIIGLAPQQDGTEIEFSLPVVPDCPIVFSGGGGAFIEFPIAVGDEVLLVFASRSIDNWFGFGGVQKQSEPGRMHNLSDGFAIPGIRSKPRAKTLDPNVVRIRNDANDAYIELNPTAKTANIHAPGGITLNGATINSAGIMTDGAGKVSNAHVHTGVQVGGSNSGPPA